MTLTIRAHFDGKVIVPDEPLSLPEGTPLTVSVAPDSRPADTASMDDRRRAFNAFLARAHARPVPHLPDAATRRAAARS